MDFINFLTNNFSVDTIIISMVISVISILIELIFKDKMPAFLKTFLPFVLGAIFFCLYKLIIKEKIEVISVISSGVSAGSLSFVIKAFVSNIKNKSENKDVLFLAVKEILNDYYQGENLQNISNILSVYLKDFKNADNNLSLFEGLMLKLKEFDKDINEFNALSISASIERAYNSLQTK
jgi:hypothetical protein